MGSKHQASCECGYSKEIVVGGSRSSFTTHSYFPYYCKNCGVVDVNVEAPIIQCSTCETLEIEQYGQAKASNLPSNQKNPVLQYFSRTAFANGNLCPQCLKYTMKFSDASVIFS